MNNYFVLLLFNPVSMMLKYQNNNIWNRLGVVLIFIFLYHKFSTQIYLCSISLILSQLMEIENYIQNNNYTNLSYYKKR